jgi:ABC-type glycerol-3-phosphate transport system permease component
LGFLSVLFLLPFFWMVTTALKEPAQVFAYPIQWIPRPVVWRNFVDAWTVIPFTTFFKNTVVITVLSILGETLSSGLSAFAFARIPFRGRDALFIVVLATMMLPPQVTLIPTFIIFAKLKWVNTFVPLILPCYFSRPFFVFLLRQFFLTVPNDIEDAACVDGCGRFRMWWNIFVPLARPAFATVMIFSFINHWNDFFEPLIYLNSKSRMTMTLGLSLLRDAYSTQWHWMMAIAVLMVLPCLVLFFAFQRYFVQGISMTGSKA